MRHALLEGYSHAEFERSFPEATRRRVRVNEYTAEPVAYMITTLGTHTLELYREAAVESHRS